MIFSMTLSISCSLPVFGTHQQGLSSIRRYANNALTTPTVCLLSALKDMEIVVTSQPAEEVQYVEPARGPHFSLVIISETVQLWTYVFWVTSVYFNIRNTLLK